MKTVMKKMFCLLLVAVMLVGAMPFQAFAEEATVWIELEPGTYTVNSDFIRQYYNGSGTPKEGKYYVMDYALHNSSFTLGETKAVMLVIEEFVIVCDNCGSSNHATGALEYCSVCNKCGGHNDSAYCTVIVNGSACAKVHCNDDHCSECGVVGCPGHNVAPATATVEVVINNAGTGKTFTVDAGMTASEVYAAFKSSALAAQYENTHGPIVTLAGSDKAVATIEGGNDYMLWLSMDTTPSEPSTPSVPSNPSDLICSVCDGAIVERGENKDRFCVACGMYEGDCYCNSNLPTTDDHSGQIQVFVGGDANITVWVNQNVRRMQDVIAQIPMAAPANYEVSWFWDASYTRRIDMNDSVPRRAFNIYVKHSPIYNGPVNKLTIQFHLNYGNNKMGDPMMASYDARMGTVLKNVTPTRKYYKFAGWYWDANCTRPVKQSDKAIDHANRQDVVNVYAKWEYDKSYSEKGEITLMIYLNGKTHSVAKVKDIEDYADDLVISYAEVEKIVEKYYKPISNRDDMDIDGLYTADTWNNGDYNRRNAVKSVKIKGNGDYIIYVMVRDAKEIPSSSNGAKADNSNPKTGDMIMTPVIVLGASATCLAVLFYLNKKRAY